MSKNYGYKIDLDLRKKKIDLLEYTYTEREKDNSGTLIRLAFWNR